MRPWLSYLICGVPRSGSSYLAGMLRSTGMAGHPEEYFWRGDEPTWRSRWNASTDRQYLDAALSEGTSPNGVFGARVMWAYLDDVRSFLSKPLDVPTGRDVLAEAFPGLRFIHMVRRDHLAQAVSFAKALQTEQWNAEAESGGEPSFDRNLIGRLLDEIVRGEEGWDSFLNARPEPWVRIAFEDLVSEPEHRVRELLRFLGVGTDGTVVRPMTNKQADATNDDWVRRMLTRDGEA